ncbi:MAG TPA: haloacid dehalogenase type II [Burkholderiales bacterium]|nr:haloacid dehalogenase type II [Burkholderiales bacterium]
MEPAAFVFDAYGTLFDVHSVVQRCETFWPRRGAELSRLWRAKQLEYSWLRSLMGRYAPFSQLTREALRYSCAALHLPFEDSTEKALMQEYLELAPYPDVAHGLKKLSGGKLAILSNGSPDMLEPLVAHAGLKLDAVLSVDTVKLYKPAPAVYQLAVSRLGIRKEQIGFVSSNCWDAIGAKSFGFSVTWINRAAAPVDPLGFTPDSIVSSLGDLAEKSSP